MGKKLSEQALAAKQALAMWALLGNGGSGFGGKLKPQIEKAEREALLRAKLITVKKKSRSYWLEVTKHGWHWAQTHLGDPLPETKFAALILRAWLMRIQASMPAQKLTLEKLLTTPGEPSESHDEDRSSIRSESISRKQLDYPALRDRIRKAYLDVTGGLFNRRVLLSDIRKRIADIDRNVLDDALSKIHFEDGTMLMSSDNPLEISSAMRDAQIVVRGEPMHILWIVK